MSTKEKDVFVSSIQQLTPEHFKGITMHLPTSPATGWPIVHATHGACTSCDQDNVYRIYSHSTLLYRSACNTCGREPYCDVQWYSKSTQDVQRLIARAIPEYATAFNAPEAIKARHDRSLKFLRYGRALRKEGTPYYREWCNMAWKERLEALEEMESAQETDE